MNTSDKAQNTPLSENRQPLIRKKGVKLSEKQRFRHPSEHQMLQKNDVSTKKETGCIICNPFQFMEAAGIEPASCDSSDEASTCVFRRLSRGGWFNGQNQLTASSQLVSRRP